MGLGIRGRTHAKMDLLQILLVPNLKMGMGNGNGTTTQRRTFGPVAELFLQGVHPLALAAARTSVDPARRPRSRPRPTFAGSSVLPSREAIASTVSLGLETRLPSQRWAWRMASMTSRPDYLRRCGLETARAVVVTMDSPSANEAVVETTRSIRRDVTLVARARDAAHARALYGLGVTDAVPETIEASHGPWTAV